MKTSVKVTAVIFTGIAIFGVQKIILNSDKAIDPKINEDQHTLSNNNKESKNQMRDEKAADINIAHKTVQQETTNSNRKRDSVGEKDNQVQAPKSEDELSFEALITAELENPNGISNGNAGDDGSFLNAISGELQEKAYIDSLSSNPSYAEQPSWEDLEKNAHYEDLFDKSNQSTTKQDQGLSSISNNEQNKSNTRSTKAKENDFFQSVSNSTASPAP